MTAEPTVDHRRIAIARDRLKTWQRHRAMLQIEPGRLEALAAAIDSAASALQAQERAGGDRAAARRRLGRAMEDLRVAVDALGRGLTHRAIAREEHAIACGADAASTEEDLGFEPRPSRGREPGRPAIVDARALPDGRVRLDLSCPGLGRDPEVRVLVRRRVGRRGAYEPIGQARGATFLDHHPQRVGRYAAYKIEVVGGPMAGAISRRALADFLIGAPPSGRASLHLEPVGRRVLLRAA